MANKVLNAKQLRKAIQILIRDYLTNESEMLELADIYPTFEEMAATKKNYKAGTIFSWGLMEDGNKQLWRLKVKSKLDINTTPDMDPETFEKVGVDASGYPLWTQPLDKKSAYDKGAIVSHLGKIWESTINNNMYEPGVKGWTEKVVA